MGAIRTTPQVDQNGQQSGQMSIEITYGGKESPFGGIDASAPPAYIAPNCFASSDGFLVVDQRLITISLQQTTLPTLFGGDVTITLIKIGTFYTSKYGYINYALGVFIGALGGGGTGGQVYEYAITAWQTINGVPTIIGDDKLEITIYNVLQNPVAASLTLPVVQGQTSNFTNTGHLALNFYNNGVNTSTVSQAYAPGDTVATVVANYVTTVNAFSATTLMTAAATLDGLGITFTANTAGAAGNLLAVLDISHTSTPLLDPPVFYFASAYPVSVPLQGAPLQGGVDAVLINAPTTIQHPSVVEVGGIAYFANLGPMILKYSGPGTFQVSTLYAGYKVISKFAGSLIGLSIIPQLLNIVQNSSMIFAWSAAENLDEWAPVTVSGNVTGAGLTQLADIESPLTGLIVTNNTAYILRAQGVSYATALGNGEVPFSFQHISLADEGEGAQNFKLICQYNETGAFVGNSDIFMLSGGLSAIGQKINSKILPALQTSDGPIDSSACVVTMGGKTFPIVVFLVDTTLYLYNPDNKTWMSVTFTPPVGLGVQNTYLEITTNYNDINAVQRQAQLNVIFQGDLAGVKTYTMYSLQEGIENTGIVNNQNTIIFPQEELLLGRDITINSLYISLNAFVTFPLNSTQLNFYFNGILFSTYSFDPTKWENLSLRPIEFQVYPTSMSVFTSHSPQLSMTCNTVNGAAFRFNKIQVYGSFDPNQKPVS
jgi:hypothetical protein